MDFGKFDNRGPAEAGQRLELRDPSVRDGEPLMDGDKPCVVIVRGMAARSVQQNIRTRQKANMAKRKKGSDENRIMEDVHANLCDAAAPLIVGFENIERDGKPLTASVDDVNWFLDLTFPVMAVKTDDDGDTILDASGQPRFEMTNMPVARQITDFSSEQAHALGNGKKA